MGEPASEVSPASVEALSVGKDITAEEAATVSADRLATFKDLLPKLTPYGIPYIANQGDQIPSAVLLLEPAGAGDSERYIIVTSSGASIAHSYSSEISTIDPSTVQIRGVFPSEDATNEEAMQALQRSITRVDAGLSLSPEPVKIEYRAENLSVKERLLSKVGVRPNALNDMTRHRPFVSNADALNKGDLEFKAHLDGLKRLRSGYVQDIVPDRPHLDFDGALALEKARIETPNKIVRDNEVTRTTVGRAMLAFVEGAHQIPTAS